MTRKEKIKKLLSDELSREERDDLLFSKEMTNQLYLQWQSISSVVKEDLFIRSRIWQKVKKNTFKKKKESRQVLFYKIYAVAVSVLLLLGLSVTLYWNSLPQSKSREMYIVCSGIRSINTFILPDSTVVHLGSNSKLTYPQTFDDKNREVHLDGQGFFSVRKNKTSPFIVRTPEMDITVLGTEFEVFNYGQDTNAEAILLNGRISVSFPGKDGPNLFLSSNEKMRFGKREQSVKRETIDADKYTTWRKGHILSFENEKLSMIIPRLEKWYNRKILCQEGILNYYRFTFKVGDESLERILYIMGQSAPLTYREKEDGNFEIYKK